MLRSTSLQLFELCVKGKKEQSENCTQTRKLMKNSALTFLKKLTSLFFQLHFY